MDCGDSELTMLKQVRSLAALSAAIAFALFAFSGSAYAGFPKELVAKHPCFKEIASPWDDPMPESKMPEAYKDWDTVYVGWWNEENGTKVCTAIILSSVSSNGDVQATYAAAYPYKGEWRMRGGFRIDQGKKVLAIQNNNLPLVFTMNEDGSLFATSTLGTKKGDFFPANRVSGSVVAGYISK